MKVAATCLLIGWALSGVAQAAPIVVGPGDPSWQVVTTDLSGVPGTGVGSGQFVNGPAVPPVGGGSFNFSVPNGGTSGVQISTGQFAGTLLTSITTLSYSTFYTSIGTSSQVPWLALWVDFQGNGNLLGRLDFEPVYSSLSFGGTQPNIAPGVWQTWDVRNGRFYSGVPGNGLFTLNQITTAFPSARIYNPSAVQGGLRFASGYTSPGDVFNANLDNVTFNALVFDFELVPELDPMGCSLPLAFSGVGLLLAGSRTRRRKLV